MRCRPVFRVCSAVCALLLVISAPTAAQQCGNTTSQWLPPAVYDTEYLWSTGTVADAGAVAPDDPPASAWQPRKPQPGAHVGVLHDADVGYDLRVDEDVQLASLTVFQEGFDPSGDGGVWPEVVVGARVALTSDDTCPPQGLEPVPPPPSPSPSPSPSPQPPSPADAECKLLASLTPPDTPGDAVDFTLPSVWTPTPADERSHGAVDTPGDYVVVVDDPAIVTSLYLFGPDTAATWPDVVVSDVLTITGQTDCILQRPLAPGTPNITHIGDTWLRIRFMEPFVPTGEVPTYRAIIESPQVDFNDPIIHHNTSADGIVEALVTRVPPGATVYVSVAASNSQGEGPPSGRASTVMAPGVPALPQPPESTGGGVVEGTEVLLVWERSWDGGSALTTTDVQVRTGNGSLFLADDVFQSGPVERVENLRGGQVYSFRLRERNEFGWSEWSEWSDDVLVVGAKPTAPVLLQDPGATPTSTQIALKWNAPDDNGRDLVSYTVQWSRASTFGTLTGSVEVPAAGAGANPTHVVDHLTPNTQYFLRVFAVNGVGPSDFSNVVDQLLPASAPSEIRNVEVHVVEDCSVTPCVNRSSLTWDLPLSFGGFGVQLSDVFVKQDDGPAAWRNRALGPSATAVDLFHLQPGASYTFYLVAENQFGDSITPPIAVDAPRAAPAAVTVLSQIGFTANTLTISWSAPEANGFAITGYLVQYRVAADAALRRLQQQPPQPQQRQLNTDAWTDWGVVNTTSAAVDGLDPATTYDVRVVALNAAGPGAVATTLTLVTAPDVPAPVSEAAVSAVQGNADLMAVSWSPPNNHGSAITRYQVEVAVVDAADGSLGTWQLEYSELGFAATVGVDPNTVYAVRLRALNGVGWSTWGDVLSYTTTALTCPPGEEPLPDLTACAACPAGFVSAGGLYTISDCTPCPAGYYCETALPADAVLCAQGQHCPAGSTTQTPCPAGSYCATPGVIQECVEGDYCPLASTAWQNCPAGSYCPSPVSSITCLPPLYCPARSLAPTQCPAGSYCPTSDTIAPCPPGAACPAGSQAISTCPPGSVAPGGTAQCTQCQAGEYAQADQSRCRVCADGSVSSAGSSECTPCDEGTAEVDHVRCEECGAGEYPESGGCALCPTGYHAPFAGFPECLECGSGSVSRAGALNCQDCDSGFVPDANHEFCVPCPVGTRQHDEDCLPCAAGLVAEAPAATECLPCSSGYVPSPDGTECTPCPVGTYELNSVCVDCVAGEANDLPGRHECTPCALGTVTTEPGRTTCESCGAGLETTLLGSDTCQPCREGTASSELQSICFPCQVGHRVNDDNTECVPCSPGTYADRERSTACEPCPVGLSSGSGASECVVCDAGEVPVAGVCQLCEVGLVPSVDGNDCELCPANMYSTDPRQGCSPCPTGQITSPNGQTCIRCPAGSFQDPEDGVCKQCPAGEVSRNSGSIGCTVCFSGYQPTFDQTVCEQCPRGTFGVNGVCEPCGAGLVTEQPGLDECSECGAGTIPLPTSDGCTPCLAGTVPGDGADLGTCVKCSKGTRATLPFGADVCEPCREGWVSLDDGLTECEPCPPNWFAPGTGNHECFECPGGTVSDGGSGQCRVNAVTPSVTPTVSPGASESVTPSPTPSRQSASPSPSLPPNIIINVLLVLQNIVLADFPPYVSLFTDAVVAVVDLPEFFTADHVNVWAQTSSASLTDLIVHIDTNVPNKHVDLRQQLLARLGDAAFSAQMNFQLTTIDPAFDLIVANSQLEVSAAPSSTSTRSESPSPSSQGSQSSTSTSTRTATRTTTPSATSTATATPSGAPLNVGSSDGDSNMMMFVLVGAVVLLAVVGAAAFVAVRGRRERNTAIEKLRGRKRRTGQGGRWQRSASGRQRRFNDDQDDQDDDDGRYDDEDNGADEDGFHDNPLRRAASSRSGGRAPMPRRKVPPPRRGGGGGGGGGATNPMVSALAMYGGGVGMGGGSPRPTGKSRRASVNVTARAMTKAKRSARKKKVKAPDTVTANPMAAASSSRKGKQRASFAPTISSYNNGFAQENPMSAGVPGAVNPQLLAMMQQMQRMQQQPEAVPPPPSRRMEPEPESEDEEEADMPVYEEEPEEYDDDDGGDDDDREADVEEDDDDDENDDDRGAEEEEEEEGEGDVEYDEAEYEEEEDANVV